MYKIKKLKNPIKIQNKMLHYHSKLDNSLSYFNFSLPYSLRCLSLLPNKEVYKPKLYPRTAARCYDMSMKPVLNVIHKCEVLLWYRQQRIIQRCADIIVMNVCMYI